MNDILDYIRGSFNNRINIREKRPGVYQLILPLYHEDGDMVDIFIEEKNGDLVLSDYGMTLMRLSYSYEIDTPNKESIFQRILSENRLEEENGNIKYHSKKETIYSDIMHVTQTYMKIGSMRFFKREVIESLFYDLLNETITKELIDFKPKANVLPIPERDDLEVDYEFRPNGHPIYLFGVKDAAKARLATISCLEYQKANLNFRSFIVHDDFEKLSRKDRSRLTNACDKQFTSLDDFKINAKSFLEREKR
ncbi:MAG: DUF1828 domain-containing protein [Bacteroidales bacterium]|nr:DUF1828 domain-containing protein [Bacteroidales bacterium]